MPLQLSVVEQRLLGIRPSPGAAFIDVISPCIAFNNHPGSTKSFDYVREHNEAVNALDVMIPRQEITVDYAPGTVEDVEQHDGSIIRLRKLEEKYDATDRHGAISYLQEQQSAGEVVTGLLYIDPDAADLNDRMDTVDVPLNTLGADELCPGTSAIEAINASLR